MTMTIDEFERLGAQYREARDAIGTHRIKQAAVENAYAAIYDDLRRRGLLDQPSPELDAAKAAVDKAAADVEWCKACTVAAGEVFTGATFSEKVARNAAYRAEMLSRRDQAINQAD
jgi:hypothetical protein